MCMANTVSILKSWDVLKSILGADAVSDNGVQILALHVRLRSNRYNDHKQKYFLLEPFNESSVNCMHTTRTQHSLVTGDILFATD